MKKNLLKKILSIALVVLLSGIIPSAVAFAAEIIVDGDYDIATSETVVDLGVHDYGDPISHTVRVYASGGSVNGANVTVNATGGLSANGGVFSGSGWANGYNSIVTGTASTSGEFSITWSSSNNNLKNGPATIRFKIEIKPALEVTWPTASSITYGQSLSNSNLTGGSANTAGSFFFDEPSIQPNAGSESFSVTFIPTDSANYDPVTSSVNVVTEKANATINIIGFTGTYDGQPHGATGTVLGIGAVNLVDSIGFGDSFSDVPGGTANWSFSGGENYYDDNGSVAIVINQMNPLISWPSASNITYGQSLSNSNLTGGSSDIEGSFVFEDPTIEPNAGSGAFSVIFIPTDSVNYNQVNGSVSVVTEKADALINITGFTGTFDGQPHGATGSADGINGEDLSSAINFSAPFTDVPGGTLTWNFTGGANYNDDSGSVEIVINKARATINVFGADVEYDGEEHGATGTATGINDADLATGLVLGSKFTNVPGGTAAWSFNGGSNYENESGSVEIIIFKADPEVMGYPLASNITYGQSLADSNFTEGLADIEGIFVFEDQAIKPNAGTQAYTVNFLPLDAVNYNQLSGSVNVTTEKADATIDITGFTGTYDGHAHGATGTAFGVNEENLSSSIDFGDTFVDVPGGTATWSFTGGVNYEDENGTVGILINQAKALVTVSGVTALYDGEEHGATGSATGVDDVNLTHLIDFGVKYMYVPGGFAIWNFYGGTNYEDEFGSVAIVINQATPVVTTWPSASNITYGESLADSELTDGSADVDGTFVFDDLSIKPVAGTQAYSVTFIPTDATNYKQVTDSVNVVTEKADATIDILGYTGIYDGLAHGATGTAVGVGGEDLSNAIEFGDSLIDVPGGTADWSFTGGSNYNDKNGSVAIVITQAKATVIVSGVTVNYDGNEHGATGTATGINDTDLSSGLDLGSKFTDVPGGTANWTFDGGTNYEDEFGSVEIVINQATPVVTTWPSASNITYGESLADSDLTGGVANVLGMFVFDDPSIKPVAGTQAYSVTFIPTDATNYTQVTGSVNVVTEKADATIDILGYTGNYDGLAHGATGTAVGVGGEDLFSSIDFGESFTDVPGGTADWTFTGGANYNDEFGSVAIVINQATPVVTTWPLASNITYGESLADSDLTDGSADVDGTFEFVDPTIEPNAGTQAYAVVFMPTDATNYKQVTGSINVVTEKADATIDITGYTGTYDGLAHGATGTAVGVGGEDLFSSIDFGESFTDVPGGTADWSFTGGANYNDENGSVEIVINQATPVLTWPTATLIMGQKLANASIFGGVSSVPGTFTFNAPLTIPVPGNFEFDATFKPSDTLNYKTLTGKIRVATHYNFSGVLQPINRDGTSVFKGGSTIPVKFKLFNAEGAPISTSFARISYVKITNGVAGALTEAISTSAATSGNLFRYDTKSQQYIFNLNTKGLKAGTYELRIILDDGTINTVRVGLR